MRTFFSRYTHTIYMIHYMLYYINIQIYTYKLMSLLLKDILSFIHIHIYFNAICYIYNIPISQCYT